MENLGIYIQVPFCQTKCTYCNFHTGVVSTDRFSPYADALCQEIRDHARLLQSVGIQWPHNDKQFSVDTVYIGGGTPSLLQPQLLAAMLDALRETFHCSLADVTLEELTLEADPETITSEKAGAWAAMGINRISFGVQSFIDEELKSAGRMHRRHDIYNAVPILHQTGIRNISFDLIAGLPKQTPVSWAQSLVELIQLAPNHVSVYMMEIDQGSRLGLEVLQGGTRYSAKDLPAEEQMADYYEQAQRELKAAGYDQYEISNWAKPGFASKHNLKYWRRDPYLGFGAGAHSFSGTQRWANAHDAASYVASISSGKSAAESVELVTRELALQEEFFLGLRQLSGIDLPRIEKLYAVDFAEKVGRLESAGLLQRTGQLVRLSPEKLNISNEVIVELLR
jgi:oxygen-independent coproporphyrinogen III oxidase